MKSFCLPFSVAGGEFQVLFFCAFQHPGIEFMSRSRLIPCLAIFIFLVPTVALSIGPYIVTDLGDLPGGDNESGAHGINSYGQVVGYSNNATTQHAFLWTPTSPNGTSGSLIDLGDLPGGLDFSNAASINSLGQVVGSSVVGTGADIHAFLWTPTSPNGTVGSMIDLGDLPGGDNYSGAFGINSTGQIIGQSDTSKGYRAFIWNPVAPNATVGSMMELDVTPRGALNDSLAAAINSYGQIVGAGTAGGLSFLWTPTTPNGTTGSTIDIGDLPGGFEYSIVTNINSKGQVVGESGATTGRRAFLWTPTSDNGSVGTMIDLGDLPSGDDYSYAYCVNSIGQVGGFSSIATDEGHAFLWTPTTPNGTDGVLLDLNSFLDPVSGAGWTLSTSTGMNEFGQLVGVGSFDVDGDGPASAVTHGFLLTPVPEPLGSNSVAILLIGVFGCCRTRRVLRP